MRRHLGAWIDAHHMDGEATRDGQSPGLGLRAVVGMAGGKLQRQPRRDPPGTAFLQEGDKPRRWISCRSNRNPTLRRNTR